MTGFSLLGGDFFPRENAFAEQMTVWRDPDAKKSKKTGQVTFVPSRHDPAKQFWREFPAVFCEEGESVRRPGVVRWVEMLQNDPDCPLERKRLIRFAISGMKYGDKDFFVNDSFSDSLTFQAALLGELGRRWTVPIRMRLGAASRPRNLSAALRGSSPLRREIRTIRPRNPPAPSSTLPSTSRSGFGCKALTPKRTSWTKKPMNGRRKPANWPQSWAARWWSGPEMPPLWAIGSR